MLGVVEAVDEGARLLGPFVTMQRTTMPQCTLCGACAGTLLSTWLAPCGFCIHILVDSPMPQQGVHVLPVNSANGQAAEGRHWGCAVQGIGLCD